MSWTARELVEKESRFPGYYKYLRCYVPAINPDFVQLDLTIPDSQNAGPGGAVADMEETIATESESTPVP